MKNNLVLLLLVLVLGACSNLFDDSKNDKNIITVTFEANGGSGNMINQTFTSGVSATLQPNTFTRSGYTFVGWKLSAAIDKIDYEDKQEITFTIGKSPLSAGETNLVLFASWREEPVDENITVTFDANGGSGNMTNQTFTSGVPVALQPNTFTRSGYTFVGWKLSAAIDKIDYEDKQEITFTIGKSPLSAGETNLVLFASWREEPVDKNITVTFEANSGSGNMTNQTFTSGVPANLPPNTFTRSGYRFIGWAESSSGEVLYQDCADYTAGDNDVTLYAKWQYNFLVPDIDKLSLYKGDTIIENVGLSDYFDQVADDEGNLYFSYKKTTANEIVIAKYDGKSCTDFYTFPININTDLLVRLDYNDSKLYLATNNAVYDITNKTLQEIYDAKMDKRAIEAFTVNGEDIYIAFQSDDAANSDNVNHNISKISSPSGDSFYTEELYVKSLIFDMKFVNGNMYFLFGEGSDFLKGRFTNSDYFRGALVKTDGSNVKKIALSSSKFGTDETFFCPMRFFAVTKDELLIMDDGALPDENDGTPEQKNRLAIFNFADEKVTNFSDMKEDLLYNFEPSF